MASLLFISDLHLSAHTPQINQRFIHFLHRLPEDAQALYILGDLFDAWIGDDDDAPYITPIRQALQAASRRSDIFFQHGNRDFLLGKTFARSCGIQLLPEEQLLDINGQRVLLVHGDQLCTDDLDYQQAKLKIRSPEFIQDFLSRPLAERRQLAAHYRSLSGEATSTKKQDIMDVNQQAVVKLLRRHNCTLLIHGHTHRPAIHRVKDDNIVAQRIVLSDWTKNSASALLLDQQDGSLQQIDIPVQLT